MLNHIRTVLGITSTSTGTEEQSRDLDVEVHSKPLREIREGEKACNVTSAIIVIPKGGKRPTGKGWGQY